MFTFLRLVRFYRRGGSTLWRAIGRAWALIREDLRDPVRLG